MGNSGRGGATPDDEMSPTDDLIDESSGSGARFRLMFERSADAILLLDTATNLFVEYNQATLDMLRCTREELSALHPSVLSPPRQPDGRESFEKANEMIAIAVHTGSHRFEWMHRSPHRDDFPVEVLLTPLPLGTAPMIVVVWRDITERKRSEEALRQTQKLESVGVLAGGIAHDFNNLLTAILGHLHLARVEVTGRAAAHLDTMEHAVLRAADLTRQMLAYSGRGQFVIEAIDLGQVVKEMVDLFGVSVPKGVRLVCELDEDVPLIDADRAQTQQVIMNMITNAGEAMGQGQGTIAVRVRRMVLDEQTLRAHLPGQNVRAGPAVLLEVQDQGLGMTPEVQARMFDPFFSTKGPGRGLGLSALLGILKAHGAGVQVRSQVGVGTSFEIFFPASTAARKISAPVPESRVQRGKGAVLLVDDERNVRASLRGVLEYLGFIVIEAADGFEAVEIFREKRGLITWVLMDLTMPRMDGYTTFLKLREIEPGVVVILSSGWAETEIAGRFGSGQPSGFLPKPFTTRALEALLARLGLTQGSEAEP